MQLTRIFPRSQKISLETFGCTANLGDTMKLRALLQAEGHAIVPEEEADVVVVNTCTVTKRTELNVLKRLKALRDAGKQVVVAGCMAAAQPDLVQRLLGEAVPLLTPAELSASYERSPELAFDGVVCAIPIATGCMGNCTYCIVKQARGELRSYRPETILEAVRGAVARGAKELRLTAQDCSAYGCEHERGVKLPQLLDLITALDGDFRVRVGMMNPDTVSPLLDELLDAFKSEKIFKFFHLPVQAGSDKVLREMNRHYTVAEFVGLVKRIRERFPDCTLSTDFIIGFPTESTADFHASVQLLELLRPEKVNATRYSPRPGTEAAKLPDLLDREKKERSRIIASRCHAIALDCNLALRGTPLPVHITEWGKKGGVISRDSAYRLIVLTAMPPLGSTATVRITEVTSTYLRGDLQATESGAVLIGSRGCSIARHGSPGNV
jgi:MiaB-like tRNA modifying enzyme